MPHRRTGQLRGRVDLTERAVGRLQLRMLGDERRQLILQRVIIGVWQRAVTRAVIQVVQTLDLSGQLSDALSYVHPPIKRQATDSPAERPDGFRLNAESQVPGLAAFQTRVNCS
ncbi:hypothetical protein GCM10010151_74530 [Actinoallomurus spadix]|uniref:Transposase n=1 Tax=Actinoallomurus spadix TaxID=79912 RepID=A0ABN0XUY8_9ACTN